MANTLYDYFKSIGQPLPSVEQRRQQYGLGSDYSGTAVQNAALLQRLMGGGGQTAQTPTQPASQPVQSAGTSSGNLWSQYQAKLKPITEQSDKLLQDYYALSSQAPTFAQRLLDSIKKSEQYPSHAEMRAEYSKNPNLTPMAVEALVSRRGQSTRGTIQDIINRATGGLEAEVASKKAAAEMAQQKRANLLEEYGLEYQQEQDLLDRLERENTASRGTVGERTRNRVIEAATMDAKGGITAEDLAKKYGGQLDDWELIDIYNQNSPYGGMAESPEQFSQWTGTRKTEDTAETAELTAEYLSQVDTYPDRETALRDFEIFKPVMEAQGVDTELIMQRINQRFPPKESKDRRGILEILGWRE